MFKNWTQQQKLKVSVIYGWGVILLFCFLAPIVTQDRDVQGFGFILAAILLSIRYSMMKPLFHATGTGIAIVSVGMILDAVFRRNDNAIGMGALFGVIIGLFFILLKNFVVSIYYLIRETFYLYTSTKQAQRY